jgi:hypothetical protein
MRALFATPVRSGFPDYGLGRRLPWPNALALIESQVNAVLADDELGTGERARLITTLAGVAPAVD